LIGTRGPIAISVVVCCFNSEQRLPAVLQHLLRQERDDTISWEVVVVDNASSDATAMVAREIWPSNARAQLHVVEERRPGLSHARRRGIEAARGAIVSFVDDDNWVCADWIWRVHDIFARHPEVGACGGMGVAVFEANEPAWFHALQGSYAVGPQAAEAGYVPDERGWLAGAGLSIRRSALMALFQAGFENLNLGRVGKALTSSEDVELCLALRLAEWRLYYDPRLNYQHFMPKNRMLLSHRRQMQFANGRAQVVLCHYFAALAGRSLAESSRSGRLEWLRQYCRALLSLVGSMLVFPVRGIRSVTYRADLIHQIGFVTALGCSPRSFAADRKRVFAFAKRLREQRT